MTKGTVVQVVGPTVDVEFPSDKLPAILNAIKVEDPARDIKVTVEAALHIGDNVVRCVSPSAAASTSSRPRARSRPT